MADKSLGAFGLVPSECGPRLKDLAAWRCGYSAIGVGDPLARPTLSARIPLTACGGT
jgi:hypothetical protein